MTLKIICAAVVIVGCGYLGILFAARQKLRVRQIEDFLQFLKAVEFNIVFLRLPLTECLGRIAMGSEGVLRKILEEAGSYLIKHKGAGFGEAWDLAVEKNKRGICTGDDVLETLSAFAARFGSGDDEREKNNIAFASAKLQYIRDGFDGRLQSDMKLYRGLGFLSGILVVILLF